MSSSSKRKRVSAPCNDRQAIYDVMAEWSFEEENKISFNVLDWIEKTVLVHPPELTVLYRSSEENEVTREEFLQVLSQNGIWLKRLAIRLGSSGEGNVQNGDWYEVFFKFAENDAKLAPGCIFSEEELFGDSLGHEDYKSVFCTLYKLANQARVKFGVPTLAETQQIGWPELNNKKREDREKCAERKEFNEMMAKWSFEEVEKKNKEIIKWLGAIGAESNAAGISQKDFLAILSSNAGKNLLGKLSKTTAADDEFYDNFRAFAKSQLPDECIFWESELNSTGYEDFKSVFCTLHMLMKKNVPAKPTVNVASSSANSNSQQKQPETKSMKIYVLTGTRKRMILENCHPDDSIQQIKERIGAKVGISVEKLRLSIAGKQMEDDRFLQDYNVQDESTLDLSIFALSLS